MSRSGPQSKVSAERISDVPDAHDGREASLVWPKPRWPSGRKTPREGNPRWKKIGFVPGVEV
jgi:hypothetical protein